mgnify:CR=1 FL=1
MSDIMSGEVSSVPLVRLSKLEINRLRKAREKIYFVLSTVIGCLLWMAFFGNLSGLLTKWNPFSPTNGVLSIYVLIFVIYLVITNLIFKAYLFGNGVIVQSQQFPHVHRLVSESVQVLGMRKEPLVFILPGRGVLNAFAVKIFRTRYVVLHAEVVDFALKRGRLDELRFIITHELAHHALSHTSSWRYYLLLPSFMTVFLPLALSRAREYSCDRIATVVVKDQLNSARALLMLAHGSIALADEADISAFIEQDDRVPFLTGWFLEVFSTHPRLTRRVMNVMAG